ncbi:sigma-70 family RNA polymerase sigma factor [Achromobacter sp. Marseille-Q0513]|uniref:RNA polymerase sigma factor n=1 Tax=Achromobacter sp. Marseille-Q0513 TaxID=2829161 RepID=UPI00201316B7|nr:sigma-70 family RNA polymerase sigma factor [Achromobacter sp. Marseille-Q0513]
MSRLPIRETGWLAQYRKLLGSWARRSSSPRDSEDAVQDTALALLELKGDDIREPEHYFRRATANRRISIHRAETLRASQNLDDLPEDQHPLAASAEASFEANQTARAMLAALAELPDACQQAFRLRQLEGLTNTEIASRLGVSRNMVERYMMRTLRHLQDRLAP